MRFCSYTPSGTFFPVFPIGTHEKLQDWKLIDGEDVVIPLCSAFIHFDSSDQEDGMVSLLKPASFTITASNGVAITRFDIVDQVIKIVQVIIDNPDVFHMRNWVDMTNLFIQSMWMTSMGHWQILIAPYGDVNMM
jgi:hypothetical protein